MAGDEVDRGDRPPPAGLVQVAGAGQPLGELRQGSGFPAPQVPYAVAVLAIPFQPQRRDFSDLVAAFPDVPRFGDQLDLRDDRILLDQVEKGGQPVHIMQLPGQRGG